jgi:hypothetical protein
MEILHVSNKICGIILIVSMASVSASEPVRSNREANWQINKHKTLTHITYAQIYITYITLLHTLQVRCTLHAAFHKMGWGEQPTMTFLQAKSHQPTRQAGRQAGRHPSAGIPWFPAQHEQSRLRGSDGQTFVTQKQWLLQKLPFHFDVTHFEGY